MQAIQFFGVILLIVTSHGEMENGKPTGLWLEEFMVPYEVFTDAGYRVVVASPKGGEAPIDPRSLPENPGEAEKQAMLLLKNTLSLSDVPEIEYKAVFFAGGHGTMFDFPNDPGVQKIVSRALADKQPLGLVCHGPAALVGAETADGDPAVRGRKVTGFTNAEEKAVGLTEAVPFLLESKLKEQGGEFSGGPDFKPHVVTDGQLVTGQNPASSKATAEALLKIIKK